MFPVASLEAEDVAMSFAFVLYKFLFKIDIKFIVRSLWNSELFIVVYIHCNEHQLLNSQLYLCPVLLAIK